MPQIQLIWAFDSSLFGATYAFLCSPRISYITTYSSYVLFQFTGQLIAFLPLLWATKMARQCSYKGFNIFIFIVQGNTDIWKWLSASLGPCSLWAGGPWRLYFNADLSSSFPELKVISLNKNARPTGEAAHEAVKPQVLNQAARPSMARNSELLHNS